MYSEQLLFITLVGVSSQIMIPLPSLGLICKVPTLNSILQNKQHYQAISVLGRERYGTCTAAVWFHKNYVAILNLYGEHITTYYFDREQDALRVFQYIDNTSMAMLDYPEHLTVSPDGTVLVVCNNGKKSYVSLYVIDAGTHYINARPYTRFFMKGFIHNIRFSPDGTYMAVASFDAQESLSIYKIGMSGSKPQLIYREACLVPHKKLKAINFTQDGTHIILGYAHSVRDTTLPESEVVVRTFHEDGTLGQQLSNIEGTFFIEDIACCALDTAIVFSDQASDSLVMYPFDRMTGRVGRDYDHVQNPEAYLSFPHGLALSQDENYLVVTNYGDDSFNLYRVLNI